VGEGGRALALRAVAAAAGVADRVGEVALAVATVVALVALAFTLPALARRRGGRAGLTAALVIATGGAGIAFVSYLAFDVRCTQAGCGLRPGYAVAGFEPWWRVHDAWQWGAQLTLASAGLMTGALALLLAVRDRPAAARALLLARVAYFSWAIGVFLVPALWELIVI
jgi:hypothetical protein